MLRFKFGQLEPLLSQGVECQPQRPVMPHRDQMQALQQGSDPSQQPPPNMHGQYGGGSQVRFPPAAQHMPPPGFEYGSSQPQYAASTITHDDAPQQRDQAKLCGGQPHDFQVHAALQQKQKT